MAQIDAYLKRKYADSGLSYQDDLWEMYAFVPNADLRSYLAAFHTNLNKWFVILNSDIRKSYDEDGNIVYSGGYFHAQDSRDYLAILEELDSIKSKLNNTDYAFRLSNNDYDDAIRRTRRFVVKSGGSTIPENFSPIAIEDLNPIFAMVKSIAIESNATVLYANLKSLGEGSYARVFSYTDPTYQIPIVLKRAKPELDCKEIIRFKQEYNTLKGLKSPYIIEVYAYNEAKAEYTMEYMDESIYSYVSKNNATLSLAKRKSMISQICRGLAYMHSKGILHRDLSLSNIFVKHYDDVDVVKLGDFGLVKIPESTLTSLQSEFKGSLNDPDLINVGFANYEMCHEIYALTRVCYFVLTGRTNIEKQKAGKIKDFWIKGTSPDRSKRYKNVADLLSCIQNITEEDR